MEKIYHNKQLVGIRLRSFSHGVVALTADSDALQVLAMKRAKGTKTLPHHHARKKRVTRTLQECLVVLKGKIRVTLFSSDGKAYRRLTIGPGQAYLTLRGGHAVDVLQAVEMLEIKNGPFLKDKVLW